MWDRPPFWGVRSSRRANTTRYPKRACPLCWHTHLSFRGHAAPSPAGTAASRFGPCAELADRIGEEPRWLILGLDLPRPQRRYGTVAPCAPLGPAVLRDRGALPQGGRKPCSQHGFLPRNGNIPRSRPAPSRPAPAEPPRLGRRLPEASARRIIRGYETVRCDRCGARTNPRPVGGIPGSPPVRTNLHNAFQAVKSSSVPRFWLSAMSRASPTAAASTTAVPTASKTIRPLAGRLRRPASSSPMPRHRDRSAAGR